MRKEDIKIGEQVCVEQAWEDEAGNYHDEFPVVKGFNENGSLILDFGDELNDSLKGFEWFPEDVDAN